MNVTVARHALLGFSLALGLLEFVDGFRLELPWMAWFYALLLLAGSAWLWRTGNRGPVVMLGVLHLLELVMLLFVFRTASQAPPAWLWWLFVLLTLGGTATAVASLTGPRTAVATNRQRAT
ncbi:hypothetical protein [Nocardioides iriomotensis]|uniref:Uncharacterized protein n=1 Tax=Nocardioides iriomotensis TaxID=715784 RepID=A0A4Q5IV54_9ACTN|nr:hypothetical protein [Nocardioides iriomotensis]RYU09867.1 hypothetical protein ETU37_18675 [Nocardioides iriomotensis]